MQIELNFEGLEIQKWNIPTDRTQRVDEKNGVICLIIMLTHGSFFVFSADDSKILVLVLANYLWLIGFGNTVRGISRVEIS